MAKVYLVNFHELPFSHTVNLRARLSLPRIFKGSRQLRGTFIETSRHEPIKYRMMSSNASGQGEAPFQYLLSTLLIQLIYRMSVCHNLKALGCLCAR